MRRPAAPATVGLATIMALLAAATELGRHRRLASGRVVGPEGRPIAGARVGVQGRSVRVRTDPQGHFFLPATPGDRLAASCNGYFIAGSTVGPSRRLLLRLQPFPPLDSGQYAWVNPNPNPAQRLNCGNCHVEIYRQWSASSHSRSAINRRFWNLLAGTDWYGEPDRGWNFGRDQPDARPVCAACHLPGVPADEPAAEQPWLAAGTGREGIHCDFCHKITDVDVSRLGLTHGRDAIHLARPGPGQQVFFGPLDDVTQERAAYLPLYRSSRYCSSCHEGTLFGTAAYTTYSEWLASSYARRGVQCQDCHMKPDGRMNNIAPGHGGIRRRPATLATHHFPSSQDPALLRRSVRLRLEAHPRPDSLHVIAELAAVGVGHCLPTGSPQRHLLLVIDATDDSGRPLPLQRGPTVPAAGGAGAGPSNYAGRPGKLLAKLLRDPDGQSPAPFWNAATICADTRLKPDRPQRIQFRFRYRRPTAPPSVHLRAIVVYRRFYKPVADAKRWPLADVVLAEKKLQLSLRPATAGAPAPRGQKL